MSILSDIARTWLPTVAACGFSVTPANKLYIKTTVTLMKIKMIYIWWLHQWNDSRQAALCDYWKIFLPSFSLSCDTDLCFNWISWKKMVDSICQQLQVWVGICILQDPSIQGSKQDGYCSKFFKMVADFLLWSLLPQRSRTLETD